jgi:hypothetical protein
MFGTSSRRKCRIARCTNYAIKNRTMCGKHRTQAHRKKYPILSAFTNLKHNAKRRGVLFTITFKQFAEWCVKVNYIGLARGRKQQSYTIDRRYNDIGYHVDNLQMMVKKDNISKYFYYDYRTKHAVFSNGQAMQYDPKDLPF